MRSIFTPDTKLLRRLEDALTKITVGSTSYLIRPAQSGEEPDPVPSHLCGLFVVSSDDPGGIPRPVSVNRERRVDLRVELVILRLQHKLSVLLETATVHPTIVNDPSTDPHPSLSTHLAIRTTHASASWFTTTPSMACNLVREDALTLARRFGQIAIYEFSSLGRSVLPCQPGPISETIHPVKITIEH